MALRACIFPRAYSDNLGKNLRKSNNKNKIFTNKSTTTTKAHKPTKIKSPTVGFSRTKPFNNSIRWLFIFSCVFISFFLPARNLQLFLSCLEAIQSHQILTDIDQSKLFSNIREICEVNIKFWAAYLYPMVSEFHST